MHEEIGTVEAAAMLGLHESKVLRLALETDVRSGAAVRAALAARRLPGRKVSRFWLFRRTHVEAFGRIERPAGRPRKNRAAA